MQDQNSDQRKKDHINLAFESQSKVQEVDTRFYYEPMLSGHPSDLSSLSLEFLGKQMAAPIWISSMTGGTGMAGIINKNLALACNEFGLGMGLGSCRSLLFDNRYWSDFEVRKFIGDQPLYANLGIAQVEQIIKNNETFKIKEIVNKLEADGLIIHINPLQEWMQPEGDKYFQAPIETISRLIDKLELNYIVKEVGHGMGYRSLEALVKLPIKAIEFAAFGGTNFSKLEQLRNANQIHNPIINVGHTAEEMVDFINKLFEENNNDLYKKHIIISGGIKTYLDGYYLISKSKVPAVYGQASEFLKYAIKDYSELSKFIATTMDELALAKKLLTIKS